MRWKVGGPSVFFFWPDRLSPSSILPPCHLSLRCHKRRVSGLFSHKCHVLIMYTLHREPSMLCYRLASVLLFFLAGSCGGLVHQSQTWRTLARCFHVGRPESAVVKPWLVTTTVGIQGSYLVSVRLDVSRVYKDGRQIFFSPATLVTSLFIRSSLRRTSLSLGQVCAFQ